MRLQGITTGERRSSPRWHPWRTVRTAGALTVLSSLLLACAPAAPPASNSTPAPAAPAVAAPAKPAEASPQVAPAKPAAGAQPAASPAAAAAPVAAKPAGPASGQIVIVNEAEPDTILPKDASQPNAYFIVDNLYDHLTGLDYSSGVGKLVPELADSWTRVDDHTWRFQLHQGVTFINGETFDADAVVTAVTDLVDPQKPGRTLDNYGTLQSAKKIDDFTVDITTKDTDPILPERLARFVVPAPNWLKTSSVQTLSTQAVGSGPYILVDWQQGKYLLLKANENYWGPNKPKIAEIKVIGRSEQTVRSTMVQAGEADLAYNVTLDQAKQAPRTIIQQTQRAPSIRINWEHPVLQDVRVRQAIAEAIDTQGMIDTLYPGGVAVPLTGQVVRQGSVGWNPNLKPYPYNPDEAKRLLQEAGAVGTPVELVDRPGQWPHADEVSELIVNWLNQVGFKTTLRHLEAAAAADALHAVKPGEQRADLLPTPISNPILDSSRPFSVFYACGGRNRIGCDPEFDRRYAEARVLSGDARDQAFQSLWAYAYDKYWYVPLFGLNWAHGASAKLQWTPRIDELVLFSEMSLTP
jgi:peptide/nickel transport system substrate-binding protein